MKASAKLTARKGGIEESYPDTLSGEEIPVFIACEKADAYRQTMHSDELIITADTIVWLDGLVMGKPADEEDARRMLRCLSGKTHQVITLSLIHILWGVSRKV